MKEQESYLPRNNTKLRRRPLQSSSHQVPAFLLSKWRPRPVCSSHMPAKHSVSLSQDFELKGLQLFNANRMTASKSMGCPTFLQDGPAILLPTYDYDETNGRVYALGSQGQRTSYLGRGRSKVICCALAAWSKDDWNSGCEFFHAVRG